jgi:hypothetical protein
MFDQNRNESEVVRFTLSATLPRCDGARRVESQTYKGAQSDES